MARIKTYTVDNQLNPEDKWIGTDGASGADNGKTKNFTIQAVSDYVVSQVSVYEPKYKVYTALLTQSGTDAPVATVLENTLGDIVWTYEDVGTYKGTLIGAFVESKTYYYINAASETGNMLDGLSGINRIDSDSIYVISISSGTDVTNDVLINTPIEIRVYN